MKTRFLTWNIQNKGNTLRREVLAALVRQYSFEIIVLQEAPNQPIVTELDGLGYELVQLTGTAQAGGVRIFLKKSTFQQLTLIRSNDKDKKLVAVELRRYTSLQSFNVAAVHLYSKRGRSEREQLWRNHEILQVLQGWEQNTSTTNRTILVGDFNANPYETNMRDPFLLRGQESRALIQQFLGNPPSSAWLRSARNFWYNPMWHLLGDHSPAAPGKAAASARVVTGSYYWYNEGEEPFWNLYDGFLVRPALMNEVVHGEMEVLIRTGATTFSKPTTEFLKPLTIGPQDSPILDDLPDHLPVTFTLTSL